MRIKIRSVLAVSTTALLAQQVAAATIDFKNENGVLNQYVPGIERTLNTLAEYTMLKCTDGDGGTAFSPRAQKLIDLRQELIYPVSVPYAQSKDLSGLETVYGGFKVLRAKQLADTTARALQGFYDKVSGEVSESDFAKNYTKQNQRMASLGNESGVKAFAKAMWALARFSVSVMRHPLTLNCQNTLDRVIALKHGIYMKAVELDAALGKDPFVTTPKFQALSDDQKRATTALEILCVDEKTQESYRSITAGLNGILDYKTIQTRQAYYAATVYTSLMTLPSFANFVNSGKADAIRNTQEANFAAAKAEFAEQLASVRAEGKAFQARIDKLDEQAGKIWEKIESKETSAADKTRLQVEFKSLQESRNNLDQQAGTFQDQEDAIMNQVDALAQKKNDKALAEISSAICPGLGDAVSALVQTKRAQSAEMKSVSDRAVEFEKSVLELIKNI